MYVQGQIYILPRRYESGIFGRRGRKWKRITTWIGLIRICESTCWIIQSNRTRPRRSKSEAIEILHGGKIVENAIARTYNRLRISVWIPYDSNARAKVAEMAMCACAGKASIPRQGKPSRRSL